MLPIYFIYLAGTAESGENDGPSGKNRLVINSLGFVIGFTIVFVLLGASVTAIGQFLTSHKELIRKISGIVMVLFGLYFLGILKPGFMSMAKAFDFKPDKLRFPGSILFGMVFSFGWTPCLGAFLGSALVLAGSSESVLQGIFLLLLYSLGLGIPFILSAILFDKIKGVFNLLKRHTKTISTISGLLLITSGILVFLDAFKYLSPI